MCGAHAGAPDLLQRALEILRAHAFAQCQIGLHAQASQRGLELVGRISQKALLGGQRFVQAAQQVIDRIDRFIDQRKADKA